MTRRLYVVTVTEAQPGEYIVEAASAADAIRTVADAKPATAMEVARLMQLGVTITKRKEEKK